MLEHQHRFRLQRIAAVFGVSRSGYYQWRRTGGEPDEKALRRAALDEKINKAFAQAKQRDGAPHSGCVGWKWRPYRPENDIEQHEKTRVKSQSSSEVQSDYRQQPLVTSSAKSAGTEL